MNESNNNRVKESQIMVDNKNEVKPFNLNPSKYILSDLRPERRKIKFPHRLKHFAEDDVIELTFQFSDGQAIFNQSDELLVSHQLVYWYISRVGEYYTKSSGEFDAEHIGKEIIINLKDIKEWKAVFINNICHLELETKAGEFYKSVELPIEEQMNLMQIQKELNRLSKSSH